MVRNLVPSQILFRGGASIEDALTAGLRGISLKCLYSNSNEDFPFKNSVLYYKDNTNTEDVVYTGPDLVLTKYNNDWIIIFNPFFDGWLRRDIVQYSSQGPYEISGPYGINLTTGTRIAMTGAKNSSPYLHTLVDTVNKKIYFDTTKGRAAQKMNEITYTNAPTL